MRRLEDPRLLTGRGRYLDDVRLPGLLHAAFVRSPHAHARVSGVDASAALEVPGVVAVAHRAGPRPGGASRSRRGSTRTGFAATAWPALAESRVRFVGEPVAARGRPDALRGGGRLRACGRPLRAASRARRRGRGPGARRPAASRGGPRQRAPPAGDSARATWTARSPARPSASASASTTAAAPPRPSSRAGIVARWEDGDLTVWTGTQIPFVYRTALARAFGLPESRVRVIVPDTGGGFGQKMHVMPEDMAVAALARAVGRPVKWTETRRENLAAASHAREARIDLEAAADADGVLLGLRARVVSDAGAYHIYPADAGARAARHRGDPARAVPHAGLRLRVRGRRDQQAAARRVSRRGHGLRRLRHGADARPPGGSAGRGSGRDPPAEPDPARRLPVRVRRRLRLRQRRSPQRRSSRRWSWPATSDSRRERDAGARARPAPGRRHRVLHGVHRHGLGDLPPPRDGRGAGARGGAGRDGGRCQRVVLRILPVSGPGPRDHDRPARRRPARRAAGSCPRPPGRHRDLAARDRHVREPRRHRSGRHGPARGRHRAREDPRAGGRGRSRPSGGPRAARRPRHGPGRARAGRAGGRAGAARALAPPAELPRPPAGSRGHPALRPAGRRVLGGGPRGGGRGGRRHRTGLGAATTPWSRTAGP